MIKQFIIAIVAIAFLAGTLAALQPHQTDTANHFMVHLMSCIQ